MSHAVGRPDGPAEKLAADERRQLVEHNGIDIIAESERTARPRDLFWPWFAANISVFGMGYGKWVLDSGISLWQAIAVITAGVVLSFALCGIIAIAGKRGSAPTMVLSRAAFGVRGQKLPGVISWLVSIGWETSLAITATLATATVFTELGWSGGTATKIIAALTTAALIVLASVAGYHTIMRMQSVLTWITGIVTVLYMALTWRQINWHTLSQLPSGSLQALIGAMIMVMTGFGLGWINIAADWSRYQSRKASGGSIVAWNTFGGSLAPVVLVAFGAALAGSSTKLADGINADPVGTLAKVLPIWFLLPFLAAAILALVSGAVLGIYSSGLTLLSLGIRIPRPAAALIDGTLLTLGTIYVVFFAQDFIGPFQSFLITLGVPLAAWAGVMISDITLRRTDYDEAALFDHRGRYGAVDWVSVTAMVISSVIGWGLVINQFADDAAWNNWQGYLLGPLGGKEGPWAYSNIGVVVALALAFLIALVGRRAKVRRQEAV